MTFVFRIAALAIVLAIGFVGVHTAQAAPIAFNFKFLQGGNTVGAGTFTIDDAVFDGIGEDTYDVDSGLLSLDFIINGIAFDIEDDFAYPGLPTVDFINGMFAGLNFSGESEDATLTTSLDGFSYEFIDAAGDITTGSVAVPEPSTLLVFAAGLLALGALKRRSMVG